MNRTRHGYVEVSGDVLVWARESLGLSIEEAARKSNFSVVDLTMWELDAASISLSHLNRIAEAYDRPLVTFFMSEPPAIDQLAVSFRHIGTVGPQQPSSRLRQAQRKVQQQRQHAEVLTRQQLLPVFPKDDIPEISSDIEVAAQKVRAWLAVPAPNEISSLSDLHKLRAWITCVERRGVLIAQLEGIAVEEFRGFALVQQGIPAIALNGRDAYSARLFTLVHELVHIFLNEDSLCVEVPESDKPDEPDNVVELNCDRVAAAVLMPADEVLGHGIFRLISQREIEDLESIALLANYFGVSDEAMALRLITLGRGTWRTFWRIRSIRRARQHEQAVNEENVEDDDQKRIYYPMKVRRFGRSYISRVIDAYEDSIIGPAELSEMLDIKLANLPRLIEEIGR